MSNESVNEKHFLNEALTFVIFAIPVCTYILVGLAYMLTEFLGKFLEGFVYVYIPIYSIGTPVGMMVSLIVVGIFYSVKNKQLKKNNKEIVLFNITKKDF